jgi:FtsH-binding integral membrane protein
MTTSTAAPDRRFFTAMAAIALIAAFAGFAPTYYLKAYFEAPALKPWVHVHAALFTIWVLLLLVQTQLIRTGQFYWHRALGQAALTIAILMVVTGILVIVSKPRPTAASRAFIFTPLLTLILFPLFVAAALRFRRDAATHKRLMLLATMMLLSAATQRVLLFFGVNPLPYLHHVATYVLILVPLAIYDFARLGRLHAATAWGGGILIARHGLHELVADTPQWQAAAAWLTS